VNEHSGAHCPVSWLTVEPGHPALPGHFPGAPVVPGVVLIDHVLDLVRAPLRRRSIVAGLPRVKFLRPLLPGQTVLLGVEMVSGEEAVFTCRIGNDRVAEGRIVTGPAPDHG
jgi:3-hydroxymyristoyl/3-hydroxydecanoyl-(acyl carrier protein) dehydratase